MKISITTTEILIPKKIFGSRVEKELEHDFPLPEYCPDIARLIKVDCTPFADSCEIEDGRAVVKGRALFDILYETDYKSRLRCVSFTQDFSQTVNLPRSNASNLTARCKVDCERIGCKLLSTRRLVAKATVGARFEIEGETGAKAVSVTAERDVFFKKKDISFDGKTAVLENEYRISESLPLNQSEKSIGEIICGNVFLQQPQITLSNGRADIKSSASVHILCEDENNEGRYYTSQKTIPLNLSFEHEDVDAKKNVTVFLEPRSAEFSPELDQYGESRVIKAAFNVKMNMLVNGESIHTVADDLFEKEFDSIPVTGTVMLPHLVLTNDVSFVTEAKIAPSSPTADNILDSAVHVYPSSVERTEGGALLNGNFVVTVMTETAEGIHSHDHSVPYSQFFPIELPEGEFDVTAETYPIEITANLHPDSSITARIVAGAKISVFNETEESFVSEVTKRVPREAESDENAVVYFFPEKGEDIWSISKRYRVDPDSVLGANEDSFSDDGFPRSDAGPILIKS